jgi:DNA polymerase-3 subunit epsilon
MIPLDRLAFVDLETTGLSPSRDRIAEIGVVTVDAGGATEWTTLLRPGTQIPERSRFCETAGTDAVKSAPRFKDIAADLHARLAGRLFVAHNARFDYGFLRAEFQRVGIEFEPPVLCSVMLSRKLYAQFERHDLDSVVKRHGLALKVRHRALPDAQLLWEFWQVILADQPHAHLHSAVETLLAGPVLPAHLDPSLIERLPEAPGVYVLHGDGEAMLHAGKAGNLKLHLRNYFRIDRTSKKALEVSHLVRKITWRVTRGAIGARLRLNELTGLLTPAHKRRARKAVHTWRLRPEAYPCVDLLRLPDRIGEQECYGLFASELKARNALARMAGKKRLCHALLGICQSPDLPCTGCEADSASRCNTATGRLRQLTKVALALAPLRVSTWPYDGPIGVKERSDLHIIEEWRYLGTAQNEQEIHHILDCRPDAFDEATFAYLSKTLSRLPRRRIVRLARSEENPCPWRPSW